MLEIGHWLDVIFMLGLCALFWHTSVIGMALLLIVTYAAEVLIDNISARMTWQWMLKNALYVCLAMCRVNILWLYVARNAL
jgi:ech hydrogenase subunit B